MLIGKKLFYAALLASFCSMTCGDEKSLEIDAKAIMDSVRKCDEKSAQYKEACIHAAQKYLEAAKEAKTQSKKEIYCCEGYALLMKNGDKKLLQEAAAAGAELSANMRLLHYINLAQAGRMDEVYTHARRCYLKNPYNTMASYWLGTMFIASADKPAQLAESVKFAETAKRQPESIFRFGPYLSPYLFSVSDKKLWHSLLLPAMSKAPFVKYASQAKTQCMIYRLEGMDLVSGEKFLAENPKYRELLLPVMIEKYKEEKAYAKAEKAYREMAEVYLKKSSAPKKRKGKTDPYRVPMIQAALNALSMMMADGRESAAIREAESMFSECRDDVERELLSIFIAVWGYDVKHYDLTLKYADLYRKYALSELDSKVLSKQEYKQSAAKIEIKVLRAKYKAFCALDRQNDMFRALDKLAQYLPMNDPTADFEKGMFLIRHKQFLKVRLYLDNLEKMAEQDPSAKARYSELKNALEKAQKQ